jgi:hypothetical protein
MADPMRNGLRIITSADACVLLTKTDLVEPEVLAAQLAELRVAGVMAPVLTLSNVTREGLDDLRRTLLPAKTYCFVGSSGVGKINDHKTAGHSHLFFGSESIGCEYDHFKLWARPMVWPNADSHTPLCFHAHTNAGHWLNPSVAGGWHGHVLCA